MAEGESTDVEPVDAGADSTVLTDGAATESGAEDKTVDQVKPNGADAETDAPIEYTDFNLPEGMQLDKDAMADFMPFAQKHKLSQEDAQAHVDIFAKGAERAVKANAKAWVDLKSGWNAEAKADKEIGGEHYDDSIRLSKVFIKAWTKHTGNEKFAEALNTTGFGDHPEFIRLLKWAGDIVDQDDYQFGGSTGGAPRTQAEIMYPNQGKT